MPQKNWPMKRVCGLDVHKDSVFCCISDENGVVFQEKFGVLTSELLRLVSCLQKYCTSEVAMESTCIFGLPVLVQSSFVTDTDRVSVIAFCMCTDST